MADPWFTLGPPRGATSRTVDVLTGGPHGLPYPFSTQAAAPGLTEADVRRIIREELQAETARRQVLDAYRMLDGRWWR